MNYLIYLLIALNIVTALTAAYFFRKSRRGPRKDSVELQEFIRNLMAGEAIVRVSVIDPANLLLRTRRQ